MEKRAEAWTFGSCRYNTLTRSSCCEGKCGQLARMAPQQGSFFVWFGCNLVLLFSLLMKKKKSYTGLALLFFFFFFFHLLMDDLVTHHSFQIWNDHHAFQESLQKLEF